MNLIIIGVSGNIEPERNIPAAIEQLRRVVQVLAQASVLHTDPVGRPGQPTYWNTAVLARTPMGHNMLKRRLRSMEAAFGRIRNEDRYASRTLDLDVLWRNGEVQDPDVAGRPFLRRLIGELLSRAGVAGQESYAKCTARIETSPMSNPSMGNETSVFPAAAAAYKTGM